MRGSCKCSCRHTTPLQVCGSSGSTVITPPNTPCGCSDMLSHPLFITPPYFITPPNTPCGCSDVLIYRTPFGPPASCTLSPGVHKISPPPRDTTPGGNIFKSQNFITGVCYLVSVTVHVYHQYWPRLRYGECRVCHSLQSAGTSNY